MLPGIKKGDEITDGVMILTMNGEIVRRFTFPETAVSTELIVCRPEK
jgi:hypothetical protein